MTDTEPASPADSALRRPQPDLHPADHADDLTGSTESGPDPAGRPWEAGPGDTGDARPHPDLLDDAAELTDSAGNADDLVPGDGTVGAGPPLGDVDALRTAEHGREAAASRADTSDTTPTPTETHPG